MAGWAGIARLGGIGDNLVASSVMRPLKRLGYMTEMITSEAAGAVLRHNPFIDKLTIKTDGDIPGGDDWQKWFTLRGKEYDHFVNLSNSMETRHALHKNHTWFWWPEAYRRKICAGSYLETAHDIVGVPHEFGPLFFPTEEEKDRALKVKRDVTEGPFLAWVISGSRIDKLYPRAPMAIARIIKELDIPVVMMGVGGAQFEHAKRVMEDVVNTNSTDKGLHLALSDYNSEPGGGRSWPPRRSLSLALQASLVVTPDSGIGWACAMEEMPKIALMSHASAENITKHWVNTTTMHADQNRVPCWPCHRLHDDPSTCVQATDLNAAACMADISVQSIMDNVKRLWYGENVVQLREAAE